MSKLFQALIIKSASSAGLVICEACAVPEGQEINRIF